MRSERLSHSDWYLKTLVRGPRVELRDAELLDVLLAGELELLLDLDLDRKPMRVPPAMRVTDCPASRGTGRSGP